MNIKQTLLLTAAVIIISIGAMLVTTSPVMAATCGDVTTSVISCGGDDGSNGIESSGVWSLLKIGIQILTAGVGVAALAGIVYGAVLYTSAGGNPEQIKKAINTFTNIGIGVIAFAGMYALLNFIIPGGIFN